MRPKSAGRKKPYQTNLKEQLSSDNFNRTEPMFSRLLSSSRKKTSKSPEKHSLSTIKNIKMLSNVKNLAIIHAYRPKQLKECLVKDKKAYKDFFKKDGQCNSNNIYLRTIIAHFREWKKEIEKRLAYIFEVIVQTD